MNRTRFLTLTTMIVLRMTKRLNDVLIERTIVFDKLVSVERKRNNRQNDKLEEKNVTFIWRLKEFVLSIMFVLLIKTIIIVKFRIKNKLIHHVESYVEFLFQLIKKNSYRNIRLWFWNIASKFIIKIKSNQDKLIENKFEFDDFDMTKNILNVHAKITLLFNVWHNISFFL